MWNTCLIGRRWKPREGWSRPVLTGDGDIASHSPLLCGGGSASLLLRDCWRQGALFLWSRNGVRVRCPVPGPSRHAPVAARGWFSFWPVGVPCFLGVRAVDGGFCGGHGPGVTPGPFPNPEAKAWHGDGTAPGRVWESNTPPQTFLSGVPVEPTLRETPPFLFPGIHRPRCSRTGLPRPGSREDPREVLCVSRYKPREKHRSCGPRISECMDTLNAYALFRTQTLHRVEQDHVSRQSNGSASCRPKLA